MDNTEKIHEQRLRRTAERRGYRLNRSKRRDPRAYDFGKYYVTDAFTKYLLTSEQGITLDEVDGWFSQP
jgi:hypothetical protein